MKHLILLLLISILLSLGQYSESYAQTYTVKIMSYNVLEYTPSVSSARKTALTSVINTKDPDILVGVEIQDQTAAEDFRNNVLNPSVYSVGTSPSSGTSGGYDNYIFYKTAKFNTPSATVVVATGKWPTYKFTIQHINSSKTIIIYGAHFTSGSDQSQREDEATAIRNSTALLGSGDYFIAAGDFNTVTGASEGAYQILVNTGSSNYLIDPTGGSFASNYYTFNAMGSFTHRYDFVFNSTSVTSGGLVDYNGDFVVVGNTGGSTTTPYTTASDHLPVYATYTFDSALPVELVSFAGELNGTNVDLNWNTETEVNNYGFNIERSSSSRLLEGQAFGTNWETIGFIEGNGNSNSPKYYKYTDNNIQRSGTYNYRLKQIDNDGTFKYSNVVSIDVSLPGKYYLSQNYPNPFNPETKIDFTIPEKQMVTLRVYNTLGEEVAELLNEEKDAGSYSIAFKGSNLPGGIYFYQLKTNQFCENKKMVLLK